MLAMVNESIDDFGLIKIALDSDCSRAKDDFVCFSKRYHAVLMFPIFFFVFNLSILNRIG